MTLDVMATLETASQGSPKVWTLSQELKQEKELTCADLVEFVRKNKK